MVVAELDSQRFFAFILILTTCRSFEVGLMAALMKHVKASLNMSFELEGIVAASPDFGVVPAGLLAIFIFQRIPAYRVLVAGQVAMAHAILISVFFPTAISLIAARTISGLCWGFAAVHFPAWINLHGGTYETLWLGLYNTCLFFGILIGYGIGAASSLSDAITWRHLYGLEGVLMLLCGMACAFFRPQIVQVVAGVPLGRSFEEEVVGWAKKLFAPSSSGHDSKAEREPLLARAFSGPASESANCNLGEGEGDEGDRRGEGSGAQPETDAWDSIRAVLSSPLYVWTVCTGAVVSGTVGFILYFLNQVLNRLAFVDPAHTFMLIGGGFVCAPIPGNLLGAWFVQHRLGGYRNHVGGARFTAVMASLALVSSAVVLAAALVRSARGADAGLPTTLAYMSAFFLFLVFGSAPTAVINGIAVSLRPSAPIAGSGLQFSLQSAGKLLIPAVGGLVIQTLGGQLVLGFHAVVVAAALLAVGTSTLAYQAAKDVSREAGQQSHSQFQPQPQPQHRRLSEFGERHGSTAVSSSLVSTGRNPEQPGKQSSERARDFGKASDGSDGGSIEVVCDDDPKGIETTRERLEDLDGEGLGGVFDDSVTL